MRQIETKLSEEIAEYLHSKKDEELVDIIEVAYRIAELHGINEAKLNQLRKEMNAARGSFSENVFLVSTE